MTTAVTRASRSLPTPDDLAFLRKLDPRSKSAVCRPAGGSEQPENAIRQRCRRRGWVLFRDLGQGFGWILTKEGRAIVATSSASVPA